MNGRKKLGSSAEKKELEVLLPGDKIDNITRQFFSCLTHLEYCILCLNHQGNDRSLMGWLVDRLALNKKEALKHLKDSLALFSKLASQFKNICEGRQRVSAQIENCNTKIAGLIKRIDEAFQDISKKPDDELKKECDAVLSKFRIIAEAVSIQHERRYEYKPG
jgi:hypothetical protein